MVYYSQGRIILPIINENVVMDYYLELMEKDEIQFLKGKPEAKKCIADGIKELQKSVDLHSKITSAKTLWKILFEVSMVYIDPDKKGYQSSMTLPLAWTVVSSIYDCHFKVDLEE